MPWHFDETIPLTLRRMSKGAVHTHSFGQDVKRSGETRTMIVIAITAAMMVVEITAGVVFGSMALLADGLHMASHAVALAINAFAYVYARRHAHDRRFSFGTGKVNALGGFTGAILLALFALFMAWESVHRLISPVPIEFNQAILVAIVGLVVNGLSVVILGHHDHDHHKAAGTNGHQDHHHHHDHNLRSAYLHVLADALTSVLAIFALLAAKYVHWIWMDPIMGIVGALLVARWSVGLLASTASILLDHQAPVDVEKRVKEALEQENGTKVTDLHVWCIGPSIYALILVVTARKPEPPEVYRERLPSGLGIVHSTVEVHSTTE